MAAREWWDSVKREVGDLFDSRSPRAVPFARQLGTTTSLPSALVAPTHTVLSIDSTLAIDPTAVTTATASSTSQTALQLPTSTVALRPTATANPTEDGNEGMSVAVKAGIVIGVLGGILVIFVLVYLIVNARKRKLSRRRQQIEDDEKINGPFADSAAIPPTPARAPRLSLRPVTQFLPNFNTQSQAEKRASRGIALTLNPVSSTSLTPLSRPTGPSAWERPMARSTTNSPSFDNRRPDTSASAYPNNPFHDSQRIPDEPVSPISSMGSFDHRVGLATTTDSGPEPVSPIGGDDDDDDAAARIGVASGSAPPVSSVSRKASIRKDLPKPLDLTTKPPSPLYAVPPSPAGTEYSMHSMAPGQSPGPSASAAAIAAAGGPAQSTVHRVQLDFKPTLDDEMEIRAGQLVRLLHEYDDGWALCIRLDRSQQGVVPRTCLSTRPVKPRPPQVQGTGNPRGGPPINPYFSGNGQGQGQGPGHGRGHGRGHGSGGRPASPAARFPPVPTSKDHTGTGYGSAAVRRPRSPGSGQGAGWGVPSGGGVARYAGGSGAPPGPAPGQAF